MERGQYGAHVGGPASPVTRSAFLERGSTERERESAEERESTEREKVERD